MVGDDIVNDVLGAQAAGIRGVLVRTGKFQPVRSGQGAPDARDRCARATSPALLGG